MMPAVKKKKKKAPSERLCNALIYRKETSKIQINWYTYTQTLPVRWQAKEEETVCARREKLFYVLKKTPPRFELAEAESLAVVYLDATEADKISSYVTSILQM